MSSLREQTISGIFWTISERFSNLFINFVIGIILARLLSPADYGTVGILMVFIAFSNVFVDSGFSSALIQKKNALASDFSTVFFFNLIVSIILYISIFFCAGLVANFYNQSLLTDLLRVLTLILIINSFSLVQNAQIVKNLNFKVLTKASVLSSVVSGIIGISLAFFGMGVWSLVFKTLSNNIIYTGMLWFFSKWKPSIVFDIKSFKEMFSYGWKLLVSGMLYTFSQNLFYLIIGKIYSPSDLGYYAKANSFSNLASSNITISIQKVTFPTLSRLQDDGVNLLKAYKKLLKSTIFITTFSMGMLFVIAEPSIIILIGEKWRLTIPLLKILCFGGLWYPINSINLNLLQAKGRSDLFLKLSIIKNTIFLLITLIASPFGINILVIVMAIYAFASVWINSFYTKKLIGYSSLKQILDILPSVLIVVFASVSTLILTLFLPEIYWLKLIISTALFSFFYIATSALFNLQELTETKNILINLLKNRNKN